MSRMWKMQILLQVNVTNDGKESNKNFDDEEICCQMKYLTEQGEFVEKLVHHINYRNIIKYPTLYNYVPSNKVISEEDA
ncbi:hypothetical protein RIR_jg10250.t1 [Rhizophagus irregularis DAOM 181602=DAOM 197198]|nr:hypothetical protein RIR_jg10250.t1 [Rhizophagus irregularis DAOM 181602=DAOM 197198]